MQILHIVFVFLIFSSAICVNSSQIFRKLFGEVLVPQQQRYYNAHSYQYPVSSSTYQQYPQNTNGYYYQPPPPPPARRHHTRQRQSPVRQEKSYKDICHMVHNDGFTNPGNVPRCPY
ncbi:uncharacterized protein LOC111687223 [Lucilia cuprina]|uniref:uncharacterized protein LOC111687223 n=1 Tax=Lucilia cuprina TaxID=7375 RepID=UPI001F0508F5|nr:uncharacterized protein LOC111687223 [Lucilia cuprina]